MSQASYQLLGGVYADIHIDVEIASNSMCIIVEYRSVRAVTARPAVRDHYLIHYTSRNRNVPRQEPGLSLGKGQGFLICPGKSRFTRQTRTPWTYAWVGFHGTEASTCWTWRASIKPIRSSALQDHNNTAHLFRRMADACRLERSREVRLRDPDTPVRSDRISTGTSQGEPPQVL